MKRNSLFTMLMVLTLLIFCFTGCSGSNPEGSSDTGSSDSGIVGKDDISADISADFPHRQTIAAGSGVSLGITNDTNDVRVGGARLINSFYDFDGKLTYNYMLLKDVVSIDAYEYFVALKKDGTVCTGRFSSDHSQSAYDAYGFSEADTWTDIKQVAIGLSQIIGLKNDGTVLTAGFSVRNFEGVDQWSDIVDIDAGESITVGLKSDGTVLTCDLAPDVSSWTDITAVSCSSNFVVGLKADGTVVAASGREGYDPRTDVSGWSNIVAVSAGLNHCVGLKADGTVVSTKIIDPKYDKGETDVESWTDIVEISANYNHTLGLKSDGTVVYTGLFQDNERCSLNNWNDIELP